MLHAVILALASIAHGPDGAVSWQDPAGLAAAVGTVQVEGSIELDPGDADRAALARAEQILTSRVRATGERIVAERAPMWLPGFLQQRALDRWLQRSAPAQVTVIDSTRRERDHGFGRSYQTTLVVRESTTEHAGVYRRNELRLARCLEDAGKLFLTKCGGIAVFWGLLAFLVSWLDRISRGYMTWRLRVLALAVGSTVAPVALLL